MTDNIIHFDPAREALAESLSTPFQSFRPELRIKGKWRSNRIRLRSTTEANLYNLDQMFRWNDIEETRCVPSTDAITYEWINNHLVPVKPGDV